MRAVASNTLLICLLSLSFPVMVGKGKVTQSGDLVFPHETGKVLLHSSRRLTAVPSLRHRGGPFLYHEMGQQDLAVTLSGCGRGLTGCL